MRVKSTVNAAIISAFTLSSALLWKDVIIDVIDSFVPPSKQFGYKLFAAIVSTILIVTVIVIIYKMESEAELMMKNIKGKR